MVAEFKDLCLDANDHQALAGLVGRSSTLVRARDEDIDGDVLAALEGNEFCVFSR